MLRRPHAALLVTAAAAMLGGLLLLFTRPDNERSDGIAMPSIVETVATTEFTSAVEGAGVSTCATANDLRAWVVDVDSIDHFAAAALSELGQSNYAIVENLAAPTIVKRLPVSFKSEIGRQIYFGCGGLVTDAAPSAAVVAIEWRRPVTGAFVVDEHGIGVPGIGLGLSDSTGRTIAAATSAVGDGAAQFFVLATQKGPFKVWTSSGYIQRSATWDGLTTPPVLTISEGATARVIVKGAASFDRVGCGLYADVVAEPQPTDDPQRPSIFGNGSRVSVSRKRLVDGKALLQFVPWDRAVRAIITSEDGTELAKSEPITASESIVTLDLEMSVEDWIPLLVRVDGHRRGLRSGYARISLVVDTGDDFGITREGLVGRNGTGLLITRRSEWQSSAKYLVAQTDFELHITTVDGEVLRGGRVDVDLDNQATHNVVRVVDGAGNAVPWAHARFYSLGGVWRGGRSIPMRSDDNGRIVLSASWHLPPGCRALISRTSDQAAAVVMETPFPGTITVN